MQTTTTFKSLVTLLYPPLCAACDRPCEENRAFCASCTISVEPVADPCTRCGGPTVGRASCGACQVHPPPYDRARAVWLFGGAVATAIKRCKYADRPEVARSLARAIPTGDLPADALLVPVPLHPIRLRQRGFNQSALIALSTGRKIDGRALERIRDTPPQAGLGAEQRRKNLSGAFRARAERVRDRHIVLVDDVVTTGATVEAASRELLRAGARSVDVLTLARAVT
jgi:ComF family protein